MAVYPEIRARCALIATAVVLLAGGCGSGVAERLLPAVAQPAPGADATAGVRQGEGLDSAPLPSAGRGISTEIEASPRPVRVYRIGPSLYLATNQPDPSDRLLAERKAEEMKKPTELRTPREGPQSRESSPEVD